MALTKKTTKVTPMEVKPAQKNNLFNTQEDVISKIKFLLWIQVVLGINRTYLMKSGKFVAWLTKTYSLFLTVITIVFMINMRTMSASRLVIQDTTCIEFLLLIFNSVVFQKKTFENFTANLNKFDEIMNINKDLGITSPSKRSLIWMTISLIYSMTECSLLLMYEFTNYMFIWLYITTMAHDSEQILFCTLLRMILTRVHIVKAHVAKTFGSKEAKELNKVDALSNKTQLDTISLHRMYELLHKCAEQLNSIMSLPMMISLFCSGLSTTMLLKSLFKGLQMDDNSDPYVCLKRVCNHKSYESYSTTSLAIVTFKQMKKMLIIYCTIRCIKYTLLVVFPCYYSSVTTTQVSHIRTMLHDAVNSGQLDKIEKRRVKAFFQLTRENEFAYALWGVIRLNMSLPLSYSSLCTTYLVIIIQFSKFID